ncbi:WhiB family transcriptional regulator [Streptomyces sp. NPDC056549]|uniref:WhiB family transcriptional regulator n=1 Tax=Streptomyces sp. NPDC056549 TaxID=3345864 RepID=UPI0036A49FBA
MNPTSTRAISTDRTPDWRAQADCRRPGRNPDWWFPTGTKARQDREQAADAKAICRECPVAMQCLQWALNRREQDGIYGGLDVQQRESLTRKATRLRLTDAQVTARVRAIWADDARGPLADTYVRSTVQGDGGHVWWRGRKSSYSVAGRVFTPRQLAFEVSRSRPPEGPIRTSCGEPYCVAAEHLTDGRMRWRHARLAGAA